MASTDTRSGFRLPWGSNRGQPQDQPTDEPAVIAHASDPDVVDSADEGGAITTESRSDPDTAPMPEAAGDEPDAADPSPSSAEEPQDMPQPVTTPAPSATQAPRKTSRLIAELVAAMRTTAETAREQALSQVRADAAQVVETIRNRSTEGVAELRRRSEEDIAAIRDWSKAEIARIREETDHRIGDRKAGLESEIAAHAAAIEQRIADVESAVGAFETDMAEFFERLLGESDPARLATMAEAMPDTPSLTAWAEVDDLVTEAAAAPDARTEEEAVAATHEPAAAIAVETVQLGSETSSGAESLEIGAQAAPEAPGDGDDAATAQVEAEVPADSVAEVEPAATGVDPETEVTAVAEPITDGAAAEVGASGDGETDDGDSTSTPAKAASSGPWGEGDESWLRQPGRFAGQQDADTDPDTAWGDRSGWDEPGGADDHESIMAAMEAEAEAATAAEAEAGAGPDADGSEPAGEPDDDPDAAAAIAARLDAFSTPEPSFAARLASFLPGGGGADDETTTTQVVVTGLVSVASIASFKRNLGRLTGVRNVSVASGPDGEFVFTVTHRPDTSFRDAIPSMPGFAARITGGDDESVTVTARDPETEG